MPDVTFVFADGERTTITARPGEMLLAAARRNGLALSSDCEVGDCQTCRCTRLSGAVELDEFATTSLTDAEMAEGEVLTCVSSAAGDVTLRMPYERTRLLPAKAFSVRIDAVERLGPSVVRLRTRTLGLKPLVFLPGQYINVKVPGAGVMRSYSMSNAPSGERSLDLLVRLLDAGAMSDYLRDRASLGDHLECEGPRGTFYLRDGTRPVLMVAGGTGLAPMLAMLRHMAERTPGRKVCLCYGATKADDLVCLDDLKALQSRLPGLEVRTAVSQGRAAVPFLSGHVTDLLRPADVPDRDIYLCGPPAMSDAARIYLTSHGAEAAAIHVERFVPTGEATSRLVTA
ncbi:2Fe-2S iron-sulfur cluster binding domain-containing protein [Aquabacter sp. L1I39]|uniref:FAD-binding oxidoreductase n=1 Tax=Aquabacter sp. L1I39 TaxID=2820278 RepID=UPI001ADBFD8A|nr:2Fe-2S iron-sulfur cluster binding domain-containing protein [Aquabacter sp. L1I39]QTL02677.1 2Fe-2S iron-sulfur cluster binding domain-containing protein [Aquabacter sp. L1I39]